jgi:hypothetical protein
MAMSKRSADQEAARILQEQGIRRPPVPVERIARSLGTQVAFEPFEGDLSGMLYREPGDAAAIIIVNSLNAKTRQRFTVAHEIGHLLLHEREVFVDRPISVRFRDARSSLAEDPEEIEANRFAAALLMPQDWLLADARRRLKRQPRLSDEDLVDRLAQDYEVSRQAMEFRLAHLGLWTPL